MLGDEGTDCPLGVVDGDGESCLTYDGYAFPANREDVGLVVVVFNEGNTPSGNGGQVDYIYTRPGVTEDGNVGTIFQVSPDLGCGAVD